MSRLSEWLHKEFPCTYVIRYRIFLILAILVAVVLAYVVGMRDGLTIAIVLLALDVILISEAHRKREECLTNQRDKEETIRKMKSKDHSTALTAVEKARSEGWLFDGSIRNQDFSGARLQGANFANADLTGAKFCETCLKQTNFHEACLEYANLRASDAREAIFRDGRLAGANFYGSCLQGTDFYNSELQGARLKYSDLRGADLRRANLIGAALNDALLRNAQVRETTGSFGHIDIFPMTDERTVFPDEKTYSDQDERTEQWRRVTCPGYFDFYEPTWISLPSKMPPSPCEEDVH